MAIVRLQSVRDYLRIWFTWKWHAFLIFSLIILTVMSYSYLCTPKYKSTAKILVLPKSAEGLVITGEREKSTIVPVQAEDINTELALIKSRDVLEDTIRYFMKKGISLKVEKTAWYKQIISGAKERIGAILIFLKLIDPVSPFNAYVNLLEDSLGVETYPLSNIIEVSLTAENPNAAVVALEKVLDTYIIHHKSIFSIDAGGNFFRDQTADYFLKYQIAKKKLIDFQKQWNIIDFEAQNNSNIELLFEMEQLLNNIVLEYDEIVNRIKTLKKISAGRKDKMLIPEEMRQNPIIIEYEKKLSDLLIQRHAAIKDYGLSSRKYKDVEKQINSFKNEIASEIKNSIEVNILLRDDLNARKNSFQKRIDELKRQSVFLNTKKLEFDDLKNNVQLHEKNYMLYSTKTEDARILSERKKRDLANIRIAEKPKHPSTIDFPNKLLMLLLSIFVGFFAGLSTPFILEFIDVRLKTKDDVEELLKLPVISSIRFTPVRKIMIWKSNKAAYCNYFGSPNNIHLKNSIQFAVLKQKINFFQKNKKSKIFNFTSSHGKEGVSTVVAGITIEAEKENSNHSVLLVCANHKIPKFIAYNASLNSGVIETIESYSTDVRLESDNKHTFSLSYSHPDFNGSQLEKTADFIKMAKPHFKYILIDSPSMLNASDAIFYSAISDISFVIIKAYDVQQIVAEKTKNILIDNNCAIGGVILNNTRHTIPGWIYR